MLWGRVQDEKVATQSVDVHAQSHVAPPNSAELNCNSITDSGSTRPRLVFTVFSIAAGDCSVDKLLGLFPRRALVKQLRRLPW